MAEDLCHREFAASFPVEARTAAPAQLRAAKYLSHPTWGARRFESAETTRLNEAHWLYADDQSVNVWLLSQLATIRARGTLEARNNGFVLGTINTHADAVVGSDGPTLQVISDDAAYNDALEALWIEWFRAPTHRPNVSGAALLKLWIRSLWKNGEFLAQLITDDQAEGPVKMRVKPVHPRRLATPSDRAANVDVFMGIRFDSLGRPAQYFLADSTELNSLAVAPVTYRPVPPDMILHEFILEEEDQARGIPWLSPALQPAADLRDYDDQVQDASRQIADQSALLYTDHVDAQVWTTPEETTIQRRTVRMAPPGWKPFLYPATQPAVQYPDYRAERLREIGRPQSIPLMLIRLDSSKHNYSSARLDTQVFRIGCGGIQSWLSGTPRSTGALSRLVDEVAREARFSVPELRRRPLRVSYQWTWPQMPHVDPQKERTAEETGLRNRTLSLTDALAAQGKTLEDHLSQLSKEQEAIAAVGIAPPPWMTAAAAASTLPGASQAGVDQALADHIEEEAVANG